jgi:hypothetical protein
MSDGTTSRVDDVTELLANGARLPEHPASTNSLKVVSFGTVRDDGDGTILKGGLHENEVRILMSGHPGALGHLYRFVIRNQRIYHTRSLVTIDVLCEDA